MEESNQQIINETDADIDRRSLHKLIHYILKVEKLSPETILNVVFVDNETIHQLNKRFLDRDRATDVLSFNVHTEYLPGDLKILGDIYISAERAFIQAKDYEVDFMDEVKRLVIHGLLHLIGYEHDNEKAEKEMVSLTEKYLTFTEEGIL